MTNILEEVLASNVAYAGDFGGKVGVVYSW